MNYASTYHRCYHYYSHKYIYHPHLHFDSCLRHFRFQSHLHKSDRNRFHQYHLESPRCLSRQHWATGLYHKCPPFPHSYHPVRLLM